MDTQAPLTPNARTSGVKLDRQILKKLGERSDAPGLAWLAGWLTLLLITGVGLYGALYQSGSLWWAVPATFLFGGILTLPGYALSHECAHGTAFRSQWLNELCFWLSSFIYFEPPHHRRLAHGKHHSHTWVQGHDAQITFDLPMRLKGWFSEFTGFGQIVYEIELILRNALGFASYQQRRYCSESDLRRIAWESRLFVALIAGLSGLIAMGYPWPVTFILLPRLAGGCVMGAFVILQHAETEPNTPDIRNSTRSLETNGVGRFLYMNMNHHVEHHLYPSVPFHRLPALSTALDGQLPIPDPGVLRTNWEVLKLVLARSRGRENQSTAIREINDYLEHR